jgi:RNA polymerase sigma factor (sigma-70 family)
LKCDDASGKLLLEGFCAGDEQSAREFVRHFRHRLYRVAFRIIGDSGSAEDVVQMAFERAWRRGDVFEPGRGSLDAWMFTIARNLALDWVRVKRAMPTEISEASAGLSATPFDPEGRTANEETRRKLLVALSKLSTRQARSVVLAGACDMTASQVALYEHIPLGTAKTRIRIAKRRLRGELIGEEDILRRHTKIYE